MNKSEKKPAFSFKSKNKPLAHVIEIDSDSDSDFDLRKTITRGDNTKEAVASVTITDTVTVTDLDDDVGESSERTRKQNNTAWADIMAKMRKGRYTAEKHKEAKESWKSLVGMMQKNQKSTTAKTKTSSNAKVAKRQLKQSVSNPSIKRVKSDSKILNIDLGECDNTSEVEVLSINNNNVEEKVILNTTAVSVSLPVAKPLPPTPITPLCPIFLRPCPSSISKSTAVSSTSSCNSNSGDNVENNSKPWNLVHTDNPWVCDNDEDSSVVPETVELNESSLTDPNTIPETSSKKTCPFYKKIPGTKFAVDAFDCGVIPGIDVYLLSHFHSDHYQGLTKKFAKTIICSNPTANLAKMKLGVSDECIRRLELNKPYIVQGVEVVLVDANHCPGSVMFILKLPNGITYLHTGDFRYTTEMLVNRFLQNLRVSCLYLDTTYCDPEYSFPTQNDAISQAIISIKKHLAYRPKTLIVCGTYCIGKERVFCAIADALNSKVFCLYDKRRVINALENPYFKQIMGDKETSCQVHVLPMFKLNAKFLAEYLASRSGSYTNIFAVKPTGWEFARGSGPGRSVVGSNIRSHFSNTVTIMGVPYSEHSSFTELREFVTTIKPIRVQPTVNVGNVAKRTSMMGHIESWLRT